MSNFNRDNKNIHYIPEYHLYLSNDIPNTDLPVVLATNRFEPVKFTPIKGKIKIDNKDKK